MKNDSVLVDRYSNAATIMSESSMEIVIDSETRYVYEVSRYGFTWLHAHVYVRLGRFAGRFVRIPGSQEVYTRDTRCCTAVGTITFVICIVMYDKMYTLDHLQPGATAKSMAGEMQKFFFDINEPNWRNAKRINAFIIGYQPDSMAIATFSHFIMNPEVRAMFRYIHPALPSRVCSILSYGPITENFRDFLEVEHGRTKYISVPDIIEPLRVLTIPEHRSFVL